MTIRFNDLNHVAEGQTHEGWDGHRVCLYRDDAGQHYLVVIYGDGGQKGEQHAWRIKEGCPAHRFAKQGEWVEAVAAVTVPGLRADWGATKVKVGEFGER